MMLQLGVFKNLNWSSCLCRGQNIINYITAEALLFKEDLAQQNKAGPDSNWIKVKLSARCSSMSLYRHDFHNMPWLHYTVSEVEGKFPSVKFYAAFKILEICFKNVSSICLIEMEHKDTAPSSEGKTIHPFPPPLYSAKVSPCCVCLLADNMTVWWEALPTGSRTFKGLVKNLEKDKSGRRREDPAHLIRHR